MNKLLLILTIATVLAGSAYSQRNRPRSVADAATSAAECRLAGAYRIDVAASDKLYSVVRGATGRVPFGDQQQFFMDLSVRLTPPDMLAIECQGNRVSVGSSRAERVTFVADGRSRRERAPNGGIVTSRVALDRDTLTFTSNGRAEDNVNVTFRSVDGGRRLRVTRRIDAEQLVEPIIIETVYDRIADRVDWSNFEGQIARQPQPGNDQPVARDRPGPRREIAEGSDQAAILRQSLDEWIGATNDRDIERQMRFYAPELRAFYLSRNTPRSAVRTEKVRAIQSARSVDIRAEEPEIVFQDGGWSAIMRFRKKYRIVADRSRTRSGEVVQELRWRRSGDGWRIISERDVRVIR